MNPFFAAYDWASTPLGSIDSWSEALRTSLQITLGSALPSFLIWGQEHHLFYNEPFADLLAGLHPSALGRPLNTVFPNLAGSLDTLAPHDKLRLDNFPLLGSHTFHLSLATIYDDQGLSQGILITALPQDLTHLCWPAQELPAEPGSVSSDKGRTHFMATLTHELRNHITPIKLGLYLLDQVGTAGGVKPGETRAAIERQLDQLTRLLDRLLDTSRLSRGKLRLKTEPLEFGALIANCVEGYRGTFHDKGLAIDFAMPQNPIPINGDRRRLVQVLENLLHNAAKFTEIGGLTVALDIDDDPNFALLRLLDTGIGIDPARLQHLYEPFSLTKRSLEQGREGLGIGLALSRGLVTLHGGALSIHSPGAGRGTEVLVRLPLATSTLN